MPTLMYRISRQFLRLAFWCMGGLERRGMERAPADGALIVACSHASHLDPMILGAAFDRDFHFLARKTLFDVPVFGWLIRQDQAFPLDREGDIREALRAFGSRLDEGKAIVMFPEGTRSSDGLVGEMKPGVGMLAARNSCPVLPVYIWGSFQSWPRSRSFPRRHRLKCLAGPLIMPLVDQFGRKDEQRRVNAAVGQALRELERAAWTGEADIPQRLLEAWSCDSIPGGGDGARGGELA